MVTMKPAPLSALCISGALFLLAVGGLPAQEAEQPNPLFWRAKMPAGDFLIRLDMIAAVSQHEYIVEGAARVVEVNIATRSSALARFYYLEPLTPQSPDGIGQTAINFVREKAEEAVSRADSEELWKKVQKSYPGATHAHTIEYRVDSRKVLGKLFKNVEHAWLSNTGSIFRP